jgi:hypothetical protein
MSDQVETNTVKVTIPKTLRAANVRLVATPFLPGFEDSTVSDAIGAVQSYLECEIENALAEYKKAEALVIQLLEEGERLGTEYAFSVLVEPMRQILNALHEYYSTSPVHSQPALAVTASPKKYPFHVLEPVFLEVDITNAGPGHAFDLQMSVIAFSEEATAITPTLSVGHLPVSTIRVAVPVRHRIPISQLCVEFEIAWTTLDQARNTQRHTLLYLAQRADVDWEKLSTTEPYDLEPVTEDAQLVGRTDTLKERQSLVTF